MLHRKLYQLCCDGCEVSVFLRDRGCWIDGVRIQEVEGDLVTLRYEIEDEDEICAWEEMLRIESIGSVGRKMASVPRTNVDPLVSDECPEAEQIPPRHRDRPTE